MLNNARDEHWKVLRNTVSPTFSTAKLRRVSLTALMWRTRTCEQKTNREVSQIGNVDVGVNVDVESHPVGCSAPQTLLCSVCGSELNCALLSK